MRDDLAWGGLVRADRAPSGAPASRGRLEVGVAAALAATAGWFALSGAWRHHPAYALTGLLADVGLLLLGAVLLRSPRCSGIGRWILVGAVLWPSTWAGVGQGGAGPVVAWAAGTVVWLALGTGLFCYPDQQPRTVAERRFLLTMWVGLGTGLVIVALVSRPEWNGRPRDAWWPTLLQDRTVFVAALGLFTLGRLAVGVWGAVLLTTRLRTASGLDRAVLVPTVAWLLVLVLVVNLTGVVQATRTAEGAQLGALLAQSVVLLLLPPALLVAVVRSRLLRAEILELLASRTGPPDVASVESALRRALHDDSLQLFFLPPRGARLVDASGGELAEPAPEPGRFRAPLVDSSGRFLGLLTGDRRLSDHQRVVQPAVDAAARELEIVALHLGLRNQLQQLRSSRDRLVTAGRDERRRLLRDLHDGTQQRLLGISLRIEHVLNRTGDPSLRRHLSVVKTEMHRALVEIRDLAHGTQPAVLTQAGLAPALRAVTDGLPIAVEIDVPAQRYSQHAETTLFFAASEALSNVVKHSGATRVGVALRRVDGVLRLEVSDDGVGLTGCRGAGLRGLADRVNALGGELTATGEPGRGTRVVASIPCE